MSISVGAYLSLSVPEKTSGSILKEEQHHSGCDALTASVERVIACILGIQANSSRLPRPRATRFLSLDGFQHRRVDHIDWSNFLCWQSPILDKLKDSLWRDSEPLRRLRGRYQSHAAKHSKTLDPVQ
jgi:hypothetical protein